MKRIRFEGQFREPLTLHESIDDLRFALRTLWQSILAYFKIGSDCCYEYSEISENYCWVCGVSAEEHVGVVPTRNI